MSTNKHKRKLWNLEQKQKVVPDRKEMDTALKAIVVPVLRTMGFSGTYPNFRRVRPKRTDCVCFQFDLYGGGFVVEFGDNPTEVVVLPSGEIKPISKIKVYELDLAHRARLVATHQPVFSHWFRFDQGVENECQLTAMQIVPLLQQMEAWLASHHQQKDVHAFDVNVEFSNRS